MISCFWKEREEREVSRAQQLLSPEKLIIMLSVQIFSNISQQFKMIPNILPKIFFKTSFHNVAFNAFIIPILIQLSNIYNITLISDNFRIVQLLNFISNVLWTTRSRIPLSSHICRMMSLTRTTVKPPFSWQWGVCAYQTGIREAVKNVLADFVR